MTVTLLPKKFDAEELLSIYTSKLKFLQSLGDIDSYHGKNSYMIYVTSLDGDTYSYSPEFIKDQIKNGNGIDTLNNCTVVNKFFKDSYLEEVYNSIKKWYNITRCRFLALDEHRRGYSYHIDPSPRLHIPLATDDNCMFLVDDNIHRLDKLGQLYLVDTTKKHSALNLGWTNRVHLVFDLKIENLDNVQHDKTATH